jgi:iron complex outermembrane receptor protein
MSMKNDLRYLALGSVAYGVFAFTGVAYAQETETDEPVISTEQDQQEDDEQESRQQKVVVTGSLLRRDEFSSTSPIQVITAETATLEGLVDTAEIIQSSSVASGSVQLNNQFNGFVVEGGTGINSVSLRGLGAQRSLVLLNGNRPGPAGVRGQVGSFDLNVIPDSMIQRVEILKDGASSIYGSDAVAGVVNIITRTSIDRPEINVAVNAPYDGGGESFSIDGAYGWNFDAGNILVGAEFQRNEELRVGERDYLSCQEDLVYDPNTGARIDRENRSITAGGDPRNCSNIYINTFIDAFSGVRYIPSPDGVTVGPVPGYRPRQNERYNGPSGQAFYEDVLVDPRQQSAMAINETERVSLYGLSNFNIGFADWQTELLYTTRDTRAENWRQFFPLVGGASVAPFGYGYANDPAYDNPFMSAVQPIILFPSNTDVTVDYYYGSTQLDGDFGNSAFLSNWNWSLGGSYSRSEGDYTNNVILADQSGDVQFDDDAPQIDYFDPRVVSGNLTQSEYDILSTQDTGNTVYEQYLLRGVVTGELFELPAGPVGLGLGIEYRDFKIDDQPGPEALAGNIWGSSSALVTKGSDNVAEIYGEVEIPLLAGQPFAEELSVNLSGRAFDYESYGSDSVYKAGFNWQVVPTFRVRGTYGTSYRAPALYELFLGDQTVFLGQTAIDPCIDYGNSSNQNLIANCAAEGIPADYTGGGSSATIITGGGAGILEAETSKAQTFGVIFTPTFANLNIAVDYFEIEVNDQVAQLGAGSILGGCYTAQNFPNEFCNLFTRAPASDPTRPNSILTVTDNFLNVNEQVNRGLDTTIRYTRDFDLGTLTYEGQATWTFEDLQRLFDSNAVSGFDDDDFNGSIGDPQVTANMRLSWQSGDWTVSWFSDFVGRTSNAYLFNTSPVRPYFDYPGGGRYIDDTEAVWYHDISARWEQDTWTLTLGMSNVFDEEPPVVSTGSATRRGNAPLVGSQYDLRGRSAFLRAQKTF